ncbi:hypothetical protein DPMN_180623 [Dreissena polymorpha]|uniref:Uncharacterized protein n=1 Tax=Dreissena polymorpha TaxID=45954 RepID=A0A9D4EH79_DREPO|nr:hypothetical protein DPMN_180623 [Dreissena polymorpha]
MGVTEIQELVKLVLSKKLRTMVCTFGVVFLVSEISFLLDSGATGSLILRNVFSWDSRTAFYDAKYEVMGFRDSAAFYTRSERHILQVR